jgi:2-hydroxy-3-oxopropionate reductase
MIVGITIGAVAEALLLCEGRRRHGQGARSHLRRLCRQPHPAVHGQRMVERDFAPHGA